MFSIAAAAAAQAAVTPPRPPQRPMKKRNSSSNRSSKIGNKSIPPSIVVDYEQELDIKPILKRTNTLATERDSSERSTCDTAATSSRSLAAMDSSSLRRGGEQSVSFSKVEIREYIVQLGDSPFCDGPPICLSNERQDECVIDALKFDEMRCRDRRRNLKYLRLSALERSQLLLSLGYSMNDIAEACVSGDRNRRELVLSLHNKKWDSFNAIKESATRRMKRLVRMGESNHSPVSSPEQDTIKKER
eukprot:CAMPEP_0117024496 /NCGR_PEP_ID=MMETSP0472-20121206/18188_1 /TAXON_ID=693140 ORGANISM="Tiarina fusus, Strain LIS" /NCGR_SAMPLE_ID=MMETSP0472 /ASSEMBLY_ACC=CAM_ASM_000603 /LENGTH=245 /DNA_ID=CAMNT_0004730947 /DNA_START=222 /DNA_END=959 /DNA_ORIENTATION=-